MSGYIRYGLVGVALILALACCSKVSVADEAAKHYENGLDLYKKGWYDQAIGEFEKAIDLKQGYASAYYGLGNAYYCKHLYDKAVKEYHKVLRYDPNHAKAHYALWLSYRALGMTGDAEKELEIYKKLSGQKSEGKDVSDFSGYSEKKDYTKPDERTTSWHATDSQTPVETKTHPQSTSRTETKETKKNELGVRSPEPNKGQERELEVKTQDSGLKTQDSREQKQKEPASTPPSAHTAPHEQPAKAKEGPVETYKQAEAHDIHPSQPVAQEQPSVPVKAEVKVAGETTHQTTPPPAKAVEQAHAVPPHLSVEAGTKETKDPAPHQVSTVPVEVKKPHPAVEKPREGVKRPGIKVRIEEVWKSAPLGKIIVGIVIYIFATQVWVGLIAIMGLFFSRKR